jgi:hypothetical protein
MGRTIPSFRLASGEEEREWKVFRNPLDKSDRGILDEMFSILVYSFIQFSMLLCCKSYKNTTNLYVSSL